MNRKKTIARVAAGFLSVVTFLSSAIGPIPAMAADSDADSGYMEDYPELKDVREMLDEDEIVEADDITVDADEDFEIEKDFKGIDYSSKKVKISLYDDDGFSPAKEGNYKPVYHADPRSGNHGYRFSRRITVIKKEEKKEASPSGAANGAGSGSGSHEGNSPEKEEGTDDAEEGNEPKELDGRIESAEEVPSNEVRESDDPEMDDSEKELLHADDGNGSTEEEAAVLQEEGSTGEEASTSAEMKEEEGAQENGSLPVELADNAGEGNTVAADADQADISNEAEEKRETDLDVPKNTAEGNTAASETASDTEEDNYPSMETDAANKSSSEMEVAAETDASAEPSKDETASERTADAVAEDATMADAAEVPAEESGQSVQEIAMTVEEFETAFEKVTAPSLAASASNNNASGAKIVSKEDEIDYEDLGIGEDVSGHIGHTTPVTVVDDDGNTYVGICAVPDDRGWNKGSELPGVSRVTDALIIKYYYYTMLDSYGEDLAMSRGFGSKSKQVAIAVCHEAIGERYSMLAGIEYERPNVGSNLRALINAYKSGVAAKPLPDMDHVFIYASGRIKVDGHWRQSYVFGRVEEEEPSNIVLQKVSSDSDMRWAYSAYYNLHETASGGTVNFRMYSDRACTQRVKVYVDAEKTKELDPIPIGRNGVSGLYNKTVFYCEPGTVYLKELTTPKGYEPHDEPFGPYTLDEGKGKTIKIKNTPQYAHVGIVKKDSVDGKGLPGARFSLYSDIEDARNEEEPIGRFTTGSDGRSNTLEVLAGKQYYIRETKAPDGYKLDTAVRRLETADSLTATKWTNVTDEPDEPENGKVTLVKSSADTSVTDGNSNYSLAGAVYTVTDNAGKSVGKLTTKEDGTSNTLTLPLGTYTVKETSASKGFKLDTAGHTVKITADKTETVKSLEKPETGKVTLVKASADPEATGPLYSLAGAVYTVTDSTGKSVGKLTTKEDGTSNTLTLPLGTYTVKETSASSGFKLDTKDQTVTIKADQTETVKSLEEPIPGKITLLKVSSMEKDGKDPDTLPIAGAVYALYKTKEDAESGKDAIGNFTVKADGTSNVIEVLGGKTYYVKETKVPEGYLPDTTVYSANVNTLTETIQVHSTDNPIFGGVKIKKRDLETGKDRSLGGATLEGAVFTIYNKSTYAVYADRKKIPAGEAAMTITTDQTGLAQTGNRTLSYGDYQIVETTPPEGYTIKGAGPVSFTIREDGVIVDLTEENDSIKNQVMRGDFSIRKIDGDSQKRMAGVTFAVTALDRDGKEIEEHTFTTDKNGIFESTAAFAKKENVDRIWFGVDAKENDSLGALPYGDYHIAEIEGENNQGMEMFEDDFSVYADMQTITLGNIENHQKPSILTELRGEGDEQYIPAEDGVVLTDTVYMEDFQGFVGQKVTVHGVLIDKQTGTPIEVGGKAVEAETSKVLKSASTSVKQKFTFDASKLAGKTVVCYEYVMLDDMTLASHTDLADEEQTVHFPSVITRAADKATRDQVGESDGKVTVIDKVTYTNLQPGKGYTMEGTLMDKETGKAVKDNSGDDVYASIEFVASASGDGEVEIEFSFIAAPDYPGTDAVAFQTVTGTNGRTYASREDLDDEAETIHVPSIETNAEDGLTGGHTGTVSEETVVKDIVTYHNLIPGKEYTVSGVLMNKETGESLKDAAGKEISAEKAFTPSEKAGSVELSFTLDSALLEGKTVVTFEELYHNKILVAIHADIEDKDQSIHYPEIRTNAHDGKTKDEVGTVLTETTIIDTVTYKNLVPGDHYKVSGILMNKGTGKPVLGRDGKEIAASAEFDAKEAEGSIEMVFTLDADILSGELAENAGVVFEDLFNNGVKVASHADLEDADQTVFYPAITTDAKDGLTGDPSGAVNKETTLVDVVTYSNLVVGRTYMVKGTLMNKADGKPLKDAAGKEVSASKTFKPEQKNGTVELTFRFDASLLAGTTAVAFEELYHNDIQVAVHTDIEDEGQSVHYPKVSTNAYDEMTKSHLGTRTEVARVIDIVHYENLLTGKEYTVKGTLMDKAAGEPIKDASGRTATAEAAFLAGDPLEIPEEPVISIFPDEDKEEGGSNSAAGIGSKDTNAGTEKDGAVTSGDVALVFTFDSTLLAGKTIVVFEDLYHNDVKVAAHADINDEDQSIYYPEVTTDAEDGLTKDHTGTIDEKVTVKDVVTYSNVIPGKEYTVLGTLMNKATGEPLYDQAGNGIVAEETFIAEAAQGTVTLTFTLDSRLLEGTTVVAFEDLFQNDILVAVHADIEDEDQSIHYPEIRTHAADSMTSTNVGAKSTQAVVVDRVTYKNLVPGKKYTVSGVLMDKSSGSELAGKNGKSITAKAEFVPKTVNGSVELSFKVDSTLLAGKTAVAFEDLYFNGIRVCSHADLDDKDQTVFFPEIATHASFDTDTTKTTADKKAADTKSEVKKMTAKGELKVVDKVTYKNLVPGKEYIISGKLMDQKTGKAALVDKKELTAQAKFTPDKASGSVELTFTFKADELGGKNLVAFEELYLGDTLVASHTDIKDEAQTVSLEKPADSEKTGSGGGKSSGGSSSYSNPKTGDTTNIFLFLIPMLLAAAGISAVAIYRIRKKDR